MKRTLAWVEIFGPLEDESEIVRASMKVRSIAVHCKFY